MNKRTLKLREKLKMCLPVSLLETPPSMCTHMAITAVPIYISELRMLLSYGQAYAVLQVAIPIPTLTHTIIFTPTRTDKYGL